MKLAVISSAPFIRKHNQFYAYSPYVKEIRLWAKHTDEIAFCCPILDDDKGLLIAPIDFPCTTYAIKEFNIKSPLNFIKAFLFSFGNLIQLFKIMLWADHIHLRCPGNVGLMGCWVQIFFPGKIKTAKYAGNWDMKSNQPRTYKWQQKILSHTYLTRNIKVLVYGNWLGSTANIYPFFTATYTEADKIEVKPRSMQNGIEMIYVGTLSKGKRPIYAIELAQRLHAIYPNFRLSLYGHGKERENLEHYIEQNQLQDFVILKGNFSQQEMMSVYQAAHFMILPSESEGWPKVVAEAMFWACVPLATKVSCVPDMLGEGSRGLLLDMNLKSDFDKICQMIEDENRYRETALKAMEWSRVYTLDKFEFEIQKMLRS
ncbi:MAG: glycosyltransferase [Bacteroidetes bacterium]|nr:glycosyltransferase [Bacteroidota bacterium]